MMLKLSRQIILSTVFVLLTLRVTATDAGVLDDITTAPQAAYSLRRLSDTYAGPAIRVRRSGDNAEMDIGFTTSGNLDTAALTTFVGGGDGFIRTWYNQTGVTALDGVEGGFGEQPRIVAGGSLITASNGQAAIQFAGNAQNLHALTTSGLIQQNDVFTIGEYSSLPGNNSLEERLWTFLNGATSTRLAAGGDNGVHAAASGAPFVEFESATGITLDEVFLLTLSADGTNAGGADSLELFLNGNSILVENAANIDMDDDNLVIGNQEADDGIRGLDGFLQELIFFGGADNLSEAERNAVNRDLLIASGILAVPEPASIALWTLLGLATVGFAARRVHRGT